MDKQTMISIINKATSEHSDIDVTVSQCIEIYCKENGIEDFCEDIQEFEEKVSSENWGWPY